MRLRLVLVLCTAVSAALVGTATASPPGSQHAVFSNTWQGMSFVTLPDTCPLFGSSVFRDVDLTDQINETLTALPGVPLAHYQAVAALHGVINAPDGTYTVAGGAFREDRIGGIAPWYFRGSGRATISGPGGTVVGEAVFQDLTEFPPQEFDLFFTSITTCHLK